MMRNSNATQRASWTVGDVCRRVLLSWLTAVLVQYLCLSPGSRSLEGLEGLAAQSVWLLLGLTAAQHRTQGAVRQLLKTGSAWPGGLTRCRQSGGPCLGCLAFWLRCLCARL